MAKITDPDSIDFAVNTTAVNEEFEIQTGTKTIAANIDNTGATSILTDTAPGKESGITGKAFYSALKDNWLSSTTLRRFKFPVKMIFEGSFIWTNGWAPANDPTRDVFRDAGFQESVAGTDRACMISLGSVDNSTVDQAYYIQVQNFTETAIPYHLTGEVNENIDITTNNSYQKSFLREQGKLYSEYSLLFEQGLSVLNFQAYSFPLSNATDLKTDDTVNTSAYSDATVGGAGYSGLKIAYLRGTGFTTASLTGGVGNDGIYAQYDVVQDTNGRWAICVTAGTAITSITNYAAFGGTSVWQAYDGEFEIAAGVYYAGNRVVICDGKTDREVYAWLQYQLRQASDINTAVIGDGFNTEQLDPQAINGDVAELLAEYVGDNLKPKGGVVLRNFANDSTNNIQHSPIDVDTGGLEVTLVPKSSTETPYPFKATGNLVFSSNLEGEPDGETVYTMYFDYITTQTATTIGCTGAGSSATFADSGSGMTVGVGEYFTVSGFSNDTINGLYLEDGGSPTASSVTATRQAGGSVGTEAETNSITIRTEPYESPGAVIVNDNGGTPITGQITAATTPFDFDYTNNVQNGRTQNTNAPVTIVALALDGAEWTDFSTVITKSSGLTFTVTSGDERNYDPGTV